MTGLGVALSVSCGDETALHDTGAGSAGSAETDPAGSTSVATSTANDTAGEPDTSTAPGDPESSAGDSESSSGASICGGATTASHFAAPTWLFSEIAIASDLEKHGTRLCAVDFAESSVHCWTAADGEESLTMPSSFDHGRIVLDDLDGDDFPELMIASEGPADSRPVLVLAAGAAWDVVHSLDVGPKGAMDVAAGEILDGASNREIVVTTRDKALVFSGTLATAFSLGFEQDVEEIFPSGDIWIVDLLGDGSNDLIVHGRAMLLGADGVLNASSDVSPVGGYARSGSFSSDSAADLLLLSVTDLAASRTLRVLGGNADGIFEPWRSAPVLADGCFGEPAVGDLNADGLTDFVVPIYCYDGANAGALQVWFGCPDGSFDTDEQPYPDPVIRLHLADFDADGTLDIAPLSWTGADGVGGDPTGARVAVLYQQ